MSEGTVVYEVQKQNQELCEKLGYSAERIEYLEELVRKYKFCSLTGLMKEADFDDKFNRVFEEWQFAKTDFTLVIADINYLHNVNKLDGWKAGNALITGVSDALKKHFAPHQIYRIGGDEFCIVSRETTMSYAKIVKHMESIPNITFVAMKADGYNNPKQMFKDADAELNKLKLAREDKQERV